MKGSCQTMPLDVNELGFKHENFDLNNINPKILILGTRITKESIEAGYYYFGSGSKNKFWKLLSNCFGEPLFDKKDKENVIKGLNKHNIVISDLIYRCYYCGAADTKTIK